MLAAGSACEGDFRCPESVSVIAAVSAAINANRPLHIISFIHQFLFDFSLAPHLTSDGSSDETAHNNLGLLLPTTHKRNTLTPSHHPLVHHTPHYVIDFKLVITIHIYKILQALCSVIRYHFIFAPSDNKHYLTGLPNQSTHTRTKIHT